jgi:hypothetical protein
MPGFCGPEASWREAVVSAIVRVGKENAPIIIAQMAIAAVRLIVLIREKGSESYSAVECAMEAHFEGVYMAKVERLRVSTGKKIFIKALFNYANDRFVAY